MDDHTADLALLSMADFREQLGKSVGREAWLTAYLIHDQDRERLTYFSALAPAASADGLLEKHDWDCHLGFGGPGVITTYDGEIETEQYYGFGNDDGFEPLVIRRFFAGNFPDYVEIAQEFRLFHNLFHDAKRRRYVLIDEDGDEEDVIRYDQKRVDIRMSRLQSFLLAKNIVLVVYFDCTRLSPRTLAELGIVEMHDIVREGDIRYHRCIIDFSGTADDRTLAGINGKKVIRPTHPAGRPERGSYEEFVIGVDGEGHAITYSCDPEGLANFFGANPHAPPYLTPVFFRKEVMAKYYADPAKYQVEDGNISCRHLWSLRLDNNHNEFVIVFLGDLGRDLPAKERLYWKSFNVPPAGSISRVNFERSFLGEFTDPSRPDLLFKAKFERFSTRWEEAFGWPLFKPLSPDDKHYLVGLHIPLSQNRSEFDGQVLALAKVLTESLNEAALQARIQDPTKGRKGILKLAQFLTESGSVGHEANIKFLLSLHDLRHGAAHRKGDGNYLRGVEYFRLDERPLADTFEEMLRQAIGVLDYFDKHFLSHYAGATSEE